MSIAATMVAGVATAAWATSYQFGSVTYNSQCGSNAMDSVFNSTAVNDTAFKSGTKTAKVDFDNFTESARIFLPSGCGSATEICLDERMFMWVPSDDAIGSSAEFGGFTTMWGNFHETNAGNEAAAYGTNCRVATASSMTVTANPSQDETPFIYTGYYPLSKFELQTRVRFYKNGTWYYGSWNTATHTL